MRKTSRVSALLFCLTVVGGQGLSATDYLSSSMTAKCLGATCQQISFTLNVAGAVFVDHITLLSADQSLWRFGTVFQVLDGKGNDVTENFGSKLLDDGIELVAHSYSPWVYQADPLTLKIDMVNWSTRSNMHGMVDYTAFGDTESATQPHESPFNAMGTATVAPEPETWLLMATGLALLGFVAWRRRDELLENVGRN